MKQHTAKKVLAGLLGAVLLSTSIPFATVTAADAETGAIIYSSDFEDSSASLPFTGRGGVESISITDSQAHSGSSSMMVSDRSKGWHGPQLLLDDICEPNKEYTVSAFAKPEWYNSIKLSLEYTDAAGERHYSNLATETSNGDWVEFSNIKFSFTSEVSKVYVYFECNDISKLYIDDFTLAEAPIIPIQDDIASIKDVYNGYFKIGTAIMASNLASPSFMDLVEKNVMEGLATQYPDVEFYAWDVVNEAWLDDGNPRKAGSSKSEDSNSSAWVRIFGDNSFIEYAFQYARKYAPKNCKLYYNDFNEYMPGKTTAIYNMAMELKEKGLIDGIGMQSHLDVGFPTASTYRKAIDKFASTGLDIQVTELDITTSDTSEAGLEKQAQLYSDIFDIYTDYADSISAVVVWGVTDDQSWRATRVPLLFDENFQAKPAYYSIVDNVEPKVTTTTTTEITTDTTPSETTTTTEPTFRLGDVNLDGNVNVQDVVLLQKYLIRKETLTAEQTKPADSNSDGVINVIDLSCLKKWILSVD